MAVRRDGGSIAGRNNDVKDAIPPLPGTRATEHHAHAGGQRLTAGSNSLLPPSELAELHSLFTAGMGGYDS